MAFNKKDSRSYPPRKVSTSDQRRCLAFGLLLTGLAVLLTIYPPAVIRYLGGRLYDSLLQSLPTGNAHPLPVIVAIDDKSLAAYGQWPWPRLRLADLLRKIDALGASGIGLDLLLAEPDRCSIEKILAELEREGGKPLIADLKRIPNSDNVLARTMAKSPVALGYKFLFRPIEKESEGQWLHPLSNPILREAPGYPCSVLKATGTICNIPVVSRSASTSGFINVGSDPDGVLRRVPLFMRYRDRFYPGLALACLIMNSGQGEIVVTSDADGIIVSWNGRQIPLDARGNLLLRYRGGRRTFPFYSAADILDGRLPSQELKDKIVFIGASASGLGDLHLSPVDNRFPGTEVHATVVDNLMNDNFLYRPGWANGAEMFLVLVLGTLLALAMAFGSSAAGFAGASVTALIVIFMFRWLLHAWGMALSPLMPLVTLLILFSGLSILNFGYAEQKARRRRLALISAQDTTILRLAALAETRDPETGRHLQRTQRYVRALAHELSRHSRYTRQLDVARIELLSKCAPLHDIGKVGIPDHILLKPGRLTADELEAMKAHTLIGAKVLGGTVDGLMPKVGDDYLDLARQITLSHHERWDGGGYPHGLKGSDIPLAGRIMALADVYDALTSNRPYKPVFSHDKARQIIIEENGKQFDPDLVQAFLTLEETFQAISEKFRE